MGKNCVCCSDTPKVPHFDNLLIQYFTLSSIFEVINIPVVHLEVHCDNPKPPENGYIQGTGPYKAGDVVQFHCNPDFMMEGQPIIACQENSRWSGKLPKCNYFKFLHSIK